MDYFHGQLSWMTFMDDSQLFIERLDYNDQLVSFLLTDGRTLLDVKLLSGLKIIRV